MSTNETDHTRQFFRHILATIAYRGGKTLRDAPESFAEFRIAETSRTPAQILAHMADLVEWTFRQVRGEQWLAAWHPVGPSTWDNDVARFFKALEQLDNAFATEQPSATTLERIVPGTILRCTHPHRATGDAAPGCRVADQRRGDGYRRRAGRSRRARSSRS